MSKVLSILGLTIVIVMLVFAACGCKVTKYVDRVKTVVDSSVIEQNEGLQRALKETIEAYEKEKEQWQNTGVVFDTTCDTVYKTVTKIEFDNGKLKSIEGRVASLSSSFIEKSIELSHAHTTIDSLAIENSRKDAQLSKKVETIEKIVERKVLPLWIWLLLVAGWIARGYWPRVRKSVFGI